MFEYTVSLRQPRNYYLGSKNEKQYRHNGGFSGAGKVVVFDNPHDAIMVFDTVVRKAYSGWIFQVIQYTIPESNEICHSLEESCGIVESEEVCSIIHEQIVE